MDPMMAMMAMQGLSAMFGSDGNRTQTSHPYLENVDETGRPKQNTALNWKAIGLDAGKYGLQEYLKNFQERRNLQRQAEMQRVGAAASPYTANPQSYLEMMSRVQRGA